MDRYREVSAADRITGGGAFIAVGFDAASDANIHDTQARDDETLD